MSDFDEDDVMLDENGRCTCGDPLCDDEPRPDIFTEADYCHCVVCTLAHRDGLERQPFRCRAMEASAPVAEGARVRLRDVPLPGLESVGQDVDRR